MQRKPYFPQFSIDIHTMFSTVESQLADLADQLYEEAEDDDEKLAELIRERVSEPVAHALFTSNLTNAAQAYIYAFNEVPEEDIYDLLLLNPSYQLRSGIKIESVELADIIFAYDNVNKAFVIGVFDGETLQTAFGGDGALDLARSWAREHCAE